MTNPESKNKHLKQLGVAVILTLAAVLSRNEIYGQSLSILIDHPGLVLPAIDVLKNTLDLTISAEISSNLNYRPLLSIISEGVEVFQTKHPLTKVYYHHSPEYENYDSYRDKLQKILADPNSKLGKLGETDWVYVDNKLREGKSSEFQFQLEASLFNFSSFSRIFVPNSGYSDRFKATFGEPFNVGMTMNSKMEERVNSIAREELKKDRKFIELKVSQNRNPISMSIVLEYFLEKNGGDLAKSIRDCTIFSKFTVRNSWITGYPLGEADGDSQLEWYRLHILDEGKMGNYRHLIKSTDKNRNLRDQVGRTYHGFGIVDGLYLFPNEFDVMATTQRDSVQIREQGVVKFSSDLDVLKELDTIDKYLGSFDN